MKTYAILIAFLVSGIGAFAQPENTFTGSSAGTNNTTGSNNTFTGNKSGYSNTTGSNNTFTGNLCGGYNKNGAYNTFTGQSSGFNNKASYNTFTGYKCAYRNTTGEKNTFFGYQSGLNNSYGNENTFIGVGAGENNVTGNQNIAIGNGANQSIKDLNYSIALGAFCRTTASNQVRIGNTNANSIGGPLSWSTLADERFNKNLKRNVAGLDFINELQPVSYEIDMEVLDKFLGLDTISSYSNSHTAPVVTTGFVAQEVEKLVKEKNYEFHGVEAPKNDKDNYALRYSEFVVPLVKAVQELTAIVENQQKEISELRTTLVNVSDDGRLNNGVQLYQNHPNPFTSSTSIEMYLPQNISSAEVKIIDADGRILKTISVNERGNTSITLEKGTLNSGVYIYALVVDGNIALSKRLIITE